MNTYKITNITDRLGKRDNNFNTTLKISYVDSMKKMTTLLKPKETIYFTANSLPISVQQYRVKNLVSVSEISVKELQTLRNKDKKKIVDKENKAIKKVVTTVTTKEPIRSTSKKTSVKKKVTDEVSESSED